MPTAEARALADGNWRDVVTGVEADENTNGRQYRLIGISFSAAPPGNVDPNPRQLRRSFGAAGNANDPLPAGIAN